MYYNEFHEFEHQAEETKKGLWSDELQVRAEDEKVNRAYVMSGMDQEILTSKEQSTLRSDEVMIHLQITNDGDFLRYKALSDEAKKSLIFDYVKYNVRTDIEFAQTRFVNILYKDAIYAEARLEAGAKLEAMKVTFYKEGE
ncbi:hypothetical protein [Paenibacillus turpanensis]|uniref:hypothetical protein n=1 Tax=Paenibacillus turpanensis TaxID=2689078 RepID=UPI00140D7115|nr:hypothetical protein [Paenibacillus turpanensis]